MSARRANAIRDHSENTDRATRWAHVEDIMLRLLPRMVWGSRRQRGGGKLLSSLSIQHFSVFVNSIVSPADVVCALSSSTLVDMYRKCGHFVTLVAGGSPGHFGMPVPRL